MKKQFLLASVSVIAALAVTSAYAGDLNQTNINQTGTNGQVIIDQTGDGNIAGTSSTDPKAVPSISNSLVQAGKNESLSVTQSGINNTFQGATPNNSAPGSLVQSGSGNVANVTQSGVASTVTLSQTPSANAGTGEADHPYNGLYGGFGLAGSQHFLYVVRCQTLLGAHDCP